jgi:outer membrane protein TolC
MTNRTKQALKTIFTWLTFLVYATTTITYAQESTAPRLRLHDAVEKALQNYPAVRAARAEAAATTAGREIARNAYLPHIELDWQQTRGTRNNVFGQFFPQMAIPPISGPLLANSSFTQSAWGSGGGILMGWEPFDFGLRKAQVDLASRLQNEAEARAAVTELEVAAGAADAFLKVVAADQAVRAARANIDRMETFSQAVHVLVKNELRPGADASRTDAELAAARSVLIQARRAAALARVQLAEAIGRGGETIEIDPGALVEILPPGEPAAPALDRHPLRALHRALLDVILGRQDVLKKSFAPRFIWQTAMFGRGSGARVDGRLLGNRGFFPDTPNWAAGMSISFTPSDFFNLRARKKQELHRYAAEEARMEQAMQSIRTGQAHARAVMTSAKEMAENAPRQLLAAQETELRVRKRYEAELGTVIEVAEAQRLLAQAEVENALARLGVWRAVLAGSIAGGDIKPFLELLGKR